MNDNVYKLWIDEDGKEDLSEFKLSPIKEYLYKNINSSSFFVFDEELREINVRIDYPDWNDFF